MYLVDVLGSIALIFPSVSASLIIRDATEFFVSINQSIQIVLVTFD